MSDEIRPEISKYDQFRAQKDGSGRTRTETLSNADPANWFELIDALAYDEGRWCRFMREDGEDEVRLGGTVKRVIKDRCCLGPLVVPEQEQLIKKWLEAMLDLKLEEDIPFTFALTSGILLRLLVDKRVPVQSVPSEAEWDETKDPQRWSSIKEKRKARRRERRMGVKIPGDRALLRAVGVWDEAREPLPYTYHSCARNISRFLQHIRHMNIDLSDCFELDDLLFFRNVPRVLRTIAEFARKRDYARFVEISNSVPGARVVWTEHDEPDEHWEGDDIISELVQAFKRVSTKRTLSFLVTGTMGSGKSATINTILGRYAMPHRHKMTFVTEDAMFDEEEIFDRKRQRDYLCDPLLRFKLQPGTVSNTSVCKAYVKMQGVSVSFTEIPSMERTVTGTADGQCLMESLMGDPETVRRDVGTDHFDLVLLVERLDDYDTKSVATVCQHLSALFGEHVWDHAVLIYTHGSSFPPEQYTYAEHQSRCIQSTREIIAQYSHGRSGSLLPSVVVENSLSCKIDSQSSQPTLPDGLPFKPRLLRAMETVLIEQHGEELLMKQKRPWWESWVIGSLVVWFVATRL
eukprot:Plantae.Rhodophyta-Purpureofilum_apyrenoidigerum.ctg14352.p1 GENE.Plantae.Rhodophyta-Purpureofilum_apyrenoidigerum.ctg14352~~Plantae.Rhodophyta-Purpureofilum_apyrenoidigerum.ctg14352.p1  ORF type:complete len:575 (+),score=86.89 Plantae.Rhodophyta-Purpureofilum_apyrenoidigerum.ctg14352:208-1932(+)